MTIDRHTRTRVYGPEETQEGNAFYERRKGVEGFSPINFTVFREAERRFKKEFDMNDVLDFQNADRHPQVRRLEKVCCEGLNRIQDVWLYELIDGSGFYFIPNALDDNQQKYWIKQAITSYMKTPNLCTLDTHYELPSEGLWDCWKRSVPLALKRKEHLDNSERTKSLPLELTVSRTEITTLIRKTRWTTLGYQYDWTTKEYNFGVNPAPFPDDLAKWCQDVSKCVGFGDFKAQAGIVNFYQPGDTLTGHVDRSERNMSVPLISISLGASCIFLLGGTSRNDPVLPILLRSGDVIFMSGRSRFCYHGVPKILDPKGLEANDTLDEDDKGALEILGLGRININIRQVQ